MKAFYKVLLRLALVLIVIGGALSIAGVAFGASLNTMDNLPPWINFGFINHVSDSAATEAVTEVAYESTDIVQDNDSYAVKSDMEYNGEKVKNIKLDIDFGTVEIKEGNEIKVEVKNVSNDDLNSYLEGDTLSVESDIKGGFHFFNLFNEKEASQQTPEITIYIPKNFHGEDIDITLGAGSVEIEKLSADNVFIDAGAGVIYANTIIASEQGEFSVGTGEIKIKEIKVNNANIDCGVGSIKMEGTIIGDSYVNCGVGKVDLILNGNEKDYNYYVDCELGTINVNNRKYKTSESASVENDNAENQFDVNCDVGSVIIKIK